MTEKLYYQTPVLNECDATVLVCEKQGEWYRVLLDKTVIFPEGGGQPSDKGFIGDAVVRDAQEINGEIWHECDIPLEVGREYKVRFMQGIRRDHTEQHTGEHILSGIAYSLFGAKNVGFHMAEEYCTIDFDIFLSEEELTVLEREANLIVRLDLPVRADIVDASELAGLVLRKKSDVKAEEVRIVYIDDGRVDSCTCCGTHFDSTGKVGAIKITDSQKYKGGTRLWFDCGGRAVNAAADMQRTVAELARGFSTSRAELAAAVRKQGEELGAAKRELKEKSKLIAQLLSSAKGHDGAVVLNMKDFGAQDARLTAEALATGHKCAALVFGRSGETTYYSLARSEGADIHMGEVCKAVNAAVAGKGGGNAAFASGSTQRPVTDDVAELLENYMNGIMKGQIR